MYLLVYSPCHSFQYKVFRTVSRNSGTTCSEICVCVVLVGGKICFDIVHGTFEVYGQRRSFFVLPSMPNVPVEHTQGTSTDSTSNRNEKQEGRNLLPKLFRSLCCLCEDPCLISKNEPNISESQSALEYYFLKRNIRTKVQFHFFVAVRAHVNNHQQTIWHCKRLGS